MHAGHLDIDACTRYGAYRPLWSADVMDELRPIPVRELPQDCTPPPCGDGAMQHHRRSAAGDDLRRQQVDMLGPTGGPPH